MGKSSNFFGQPIYGQLIKSLDREKIVKLSRKYGGERYVKHFDGFTHLLTMLYAVIQRFDSLREIETSMTAEVRKLQKWEGDKTFSLSRTQKPNLFGLRRGKKRGMNMNHKTDSERSANDAAARPHLPQPTRRSHSRIPPMVCPLII